MLGRGWIAALASALAVVAIAAGCGAGSGRTATTTARPLSEAERRLEGLVSRIAAIMAADAGGISECDADEPSCRRRQASGLAQDARVQERAVAAAGRAPGLAPCMAPVVQGLRAQLRAIERLGQDQALAAEGANDIIGRDLARIGGLGRRVARFARACGSPAIADAALQLY
jgi:hypothetical protein